MLPVEGVMQLLSMDYTEVLNHIRRGRLSSRDKVVREANRRGLLYGMSLRASGSRLPRQEAKFRAVVTTSGQDQDRSCAVPERWRPLFERVFIKAALHAAHTDRNVSARSQ
jgi:hypothetical protein